MAMQRARWINDEVQCPAFGAVGLAWPAAGCNDPDSCEFEAFMFMADGDPEELGYYCDPDRDLQFIDQEADHA